jgi:hypothetical protein
MPMCKYISQSLLEGLEVYFEKEKLTKGFTPIEAGKLNQHFYVIQKGRVSLMIDAQRLDQAKLFPHNQISPG